MYKPIDKDDVLKIVKARGPVIPIHLKKELNTDTIMIGAVLSQLIAEGKVKVTTVKIGGSPNYYTPGTEDKLVSLIRYLNEKDRKVAEMLQEKKLMKDSDQDPLIRVCLRNIKDYAKPLEVTIKGQKEIYWKWFLLPTPDAEVLIAKELKPHKEVIVVKEEEKPVKKIAEKKEEKPKAKKEEEKEKTVPVPEKKLEKQEKPEKQRAKKEEKPAPDKKEERQETLVRKDFSKVAKPNMLLDEEKDLFFTQVRAYLDAQECAILEYKIVKKGEIDLFVLVPTKLGSQEYFCKAKNKKKVADADLASAYEQGHEVNLPIIFLSPGEPGKKTKDLMSSQFKGIIFKKI